MKKEIIITIFILFFGIGCTHATENPSDKYKKQVTYPTIPSYSRKIPTSQTQKNINTNTGNNNSSKKAQLDGIATSMLKAAEQHKDISSYQMKFMDMGVTGICPPQIIAKRTPQCPPIKIQVNGKALSGSKCAITCYQYNNKQYDVGYCK